jgi:hypothetical protein
VEQDKPMKKSKDGLNVARARLLRRLYLKEDRLQKELARVGQARQKLAREYSKAAGFMMIPGRERLRAEVFKEEYDA